MAHKNEKTGAGRQSPTAGRDDEDVDQPRPDPTAQADGDDGDPATGGIPTSTGDRMGKGKTQRGPTGEGQIGNAQTAPGGARDRTAGPPGRK